MMLLFLYLAMPAIPLVAQAPEALEAEKTLSPYFYIRSDNSSVDHLPLLSTNVDVAIAGVIADVAVTQIYKNEGSRPIEALYVFPASTRAAVYGMKMTIGDRSVVAEIREREQARLIYEEARQAGMSASLLEQYRPNVFQMNLANIMPGDTIVIELRYTELLTPHDGVYEFVYPTVVGPRYSHKIAGGSPLAGIYVASPYQHEDRNPLSTFGMSVHLVAGVPIQEIVCPTHEIRTSYDEDDAVSIELMPGETNGGNRDFILRYRLDGGGILTGLLLAPGSEEDYFLLMIQPPRRVEIKDVPPREYIFIMDVSGSMEGFPIETSKTLFRRLLAQLRPVDLFNVLFFAGDNWVLSKHSLPASDKNVKYALDRVGKQNGSGGTELLPALQIALALPRREEASRTIVIATDGYVDVEAKAFDLIRNNLGDANLFAFGIGQSVNRHLIEGLAHVGMGEPFIVSKPQEAEVTAARFLEYVASPVLTHIRLEYEGFSAYDVEPEAVPDLFAQRPVAVFGKWHGAAQGVITVTGRTSEGTYHQQINVADAIESPWGAALRFLWARHRIQRLADLGSPQYPYAAGRIAHANEDNPSVQEVTQLGLKYNLLTPYTSFVAVDHVVRSDAPPEKVRQPLAMPEGLSVGAAELPLVNSNVMSFVRISTGSGSLLLESSSSVGIVLQRRNPLEDIPLSGDRSWRKLMLLAPGATLPVSSVVDPPLFRAGNGPHLDGQSRHSNSYQVNGVEMGWAAAGAPFLIPSANAVDEVRVFKGPFDANLGHEVGAVILKAGTNAIHGSAYAFGNGDATSAADYFSHMRPNTRFAQMGVDMGGYIIKNKLFFFAAYQHTTADQGRMFRLVLPTEAFRQGNFGTADTVVYDPATGNPDGSGRQPFADNRISPERISPIAQRILSLLPEPNRTDAAPGQVNYETTRMYTSRTQALDARLDWNVDSRNRLSAIMSLARPKTRTPALLADFGGPMNTGMSGDTRQLAASSNLNYTSTWTPTLLTEANVGWSQYNARSVIPGLRPGFADVLGIPGIYSNGIAAGIPSISIDGYSGPLVGFAGNLPGDRHLSILQINAMATKIWGYHCWRAGMDIRRRRENMFGGLGDAGPRGAYRFGALQTADAGDVSSQGGLANALASFLLDASDSFERNLPAGAFGMYRNELAFFANDEWKVTDKITVNLGWRYEYHAAPVGLDTRGGLSDYNPATNTLRVSGYGTVPSNLGVAGYHHWLLPRASAAWQITPKTTVRGGYGIQALLPVEGWHAANFPRVQNDQIAKTGAFLSAGSLASGLPSAISVPIPSSGLLEADATELLAQSYFDVPRTMIEGRLRVWNIGVMQNLPFDLGIDARYVGSRGVDVPLLLDLNAGLQPGAGDAGRPQFAAFGRRASTFTWWASRTGYDAFQMSLENQGGKLWFKTSYTLGRSRDHAGENRRISTPADPEGSWGRSDFDRRHAFTTAFTLHSGDRASSYGRFGDILKDWRLSGYFVAQSGTPIDITASNGLLNAPYNTQRPDMRAVPGILGGVGPGQAYFDASVFSMPVAAAWGNVRRNDTVDGPGIFRMDMAISKDVSLGGEARIQLRVECFNITNSPQFVNPSGEFGTPTFGQITATAAGSERSMRFGARFSF